MSDLSWKSKVKLQVTAVTKLCSSADNRQHLKSLYNPQQELHSKAGTGKLFRERNKLHTHTALSSASLRISTISETHNNIMQMWSAAG